MSSGRGKRAWGAYLLEMALIVISILLAFSLESWRAGREQEAGQQAAKETILADFRSLQPVIDETVERADSSLVRKVRLLEALRDPPSAGVDSIQELFRASMQTIPRLPVPPSYRMALASGELRMVDDPELMDAMMLVEFVDQQLAEARRVAADVLFSGVQASVASRLGSDGVLSGEPNVPTRFTAVDYLTLVSAADVYGAAERSMMASRDLALALRQLRFAAEQVIEALSEGGP